MFEVFMTLVAAGFVLGVFGILLSTAYRVGHANGVTAERLRWHEVEMRLERQMLDGALKGEEFQEGER